VAPDEPTLSCHDGPHGAESLGARCRPDARPPGAAADIVARVLDAGMPDDVREALAGAPEDERALLELRLSWTELDDAAARMAARLRVLLVTWDPLGWQDRPPARATATGNGDDCEVVLYVPLYDLLDRARASGAGVAAELGSLAASVLDVGARYEQALVAGIYPQLAYTGKAPGLLSEVGQLSALGSPAVELRHGEWEPIGLGAIQDLVQETFGPVDLDRSRVRLAAVSEPVDGCPACAGQRFGFPAELLDAQPEMCAEHAEQAQVVADERTTRGWESNRDGMDAILGTSEMLFAPTYGLSLALLRRLDEVADRGFEDGLEPAELVADAELALAIAARCDAEQLEELLASDLMPPEWLLELPTALGRAGLIDEAVAVADAFAALDDLAAGSFARDAARVLAEAGRREEALVRVEEETRSFPDDPWAYITAGDVHRELGDADAAEDAFRTAVTLARRDGLAADLLGAMSRLAALLSEQPGREDEADAIARESERMERAAYGGSRLVGPKVGRNDPCPCGSGRKHKRCCGA
jgi:tetratricopeptide (TPR) repeat protein